MPNDITKPGTGILPIFGAILGERQFQDTKFGPLTNGGGHTLGEWILIAEAELAEAKLALIKGGTGRNSLRSELIQTAAVILAALEQHGIVDPHEGRQV
jgi:hypothetical protein